MAELVNQLDLMKKFDLIGKSFTANQWIFSDERFQKFFNFFTQNITELNIISNLETFEYEELCQASENDNIPFVKLEEPKFKNNELPDVLADIKKLNSYQLNAILSEVTALSQYEQNYIELEETARIAKIESQSPLARLKEEFCVLQTEESEIFKQCQTQTKQLELLQEENKLLYIESQNCFVKVISPPLLLCHLPLEQYFAKCDSFAQYLTLYIQENFKVQELLKHKNDTTDMKELKLKLQSLETIILDFSFKLIEEKAKSTATRSMINELDVNRIHASNMIHMERKCQQLELLNEHLKMANETLRNDLRTQQQKHTQQSIELVLYENTKLKLKRCSRRRVVGKDLIVVLSDTLINAELVWIAIHLDLERIQNRTNNLKNLATEAHKTLRRIKQMNILKASATCKILSSDFIDSLSNLLMLTHNTEIMNIEKKTCLYEYEKFRNLVADAFQKLVNGRAYKAIKKQIAQIALLSEQLRPFVYDSPIKAPLLYDVDMLRPIYNARIKKKEIENDIRSLRSLHQTNITEKMNPSGGSNKSTAFFAASQLLWIWFLTQPTRLIRAIEEVKRAADNVPAISNLKTLSGIKRKNVN